MSDDALSQFLRSLRELELVGPGQLHQLEEKLRESPASVADVARNLVHRGWLTPFQANLLNRGAGPDLLVGDYVLLNRLGGGGMGHVFMARHRKLGRVEALKIIRDDLLHNPVVARQLVGRFVRERAAIAQLAHPHVVKVFNAGEDRGRQFLVMEYLEGTDLEALVRDVGPLPVAQACAYIDQAIQGLQHLHEHHMVHRDIKPRNLMVTARESQVKILDLGLVLIHEGHGDQETGEELSRFVQGMGTRPYMAPEQEVRPHTVDVRADLYGLGCTFWFLLTGKLPPPAGTAKPAQLRDLCAEAPASLADLVCKLMAHHPQDRYQTPEELGAALALIRSSRPSAVVAAPPSTATHLAGPAPETIVAGDTELPMMSVTRLRGPSAWNIIRRPLAVGLTAAAFLFVLCFGAWLWKAANDRKAPDSTGTEPGLVEAANTKPSPIAPVEPPGLLGENRTLVRHTAPVSSVAFLPNGDRGLSCRWSEVILWDLKKSAVLQRYAPREITFELPKLEDINPREPPRMNPPDIEERRIEMAGVIAAAISPDGRRAIFGGMDHVVLWDVDNWKKRRVAGKSSGGTLYSFVAYSPAGDLALHVDQSSIVHLWNMKDEKELDISYKGCVACFSPDAARVLVGTGGPFYNQKVTLQLYETLSQKLVRRFGEHIGQVTCVTISPDGHQALSAGSREQDIVVWDLGQFAEVQRLKGHTKAVRSVAFSSDGKRALSGSEDATARLWDLSTGQEIGIFKEHVQAVNSVAFSPGGGYALLGSEDHTVGVWHLPR
jgi:WD40 repeat protein